MFKKMSTVSLIYKSGVLPLTNNIKELYFSLAHNAYEISNEKKNIKDFMKAIYSVSSMRFTRNHSLIKYK